MIEIVEQGHEIIDPPSNEVDVLKELERIARTCYKSEERISDDGESAKKLITTLLDRNHGAMLEFVNINVRFVMSRGISHEMVRHRHCSFAQESTRYVNYGNKPMKFIRPTWIREYTSDELTNKVNDPSFVVVSSKDPVDLWLDQMREASNTYQHLLSNGCIPQEARGVLPNDLKTEIVVGANVREWKHIFSLRNATAAHPDIQRLMAGVEKDFNLLMPTLFPLRGGE